MPDSGCLDKCILPGSHTVYARIPEYFVPFACLDITILDAEDEQALVTGIGKNEMGPVLRLKGLCGRIRLNAECILIE